MQEMQRRRSGTNWRAPPAPMPNLAGARGGHMRAGRHGERAGAQHLRGHRARAGGGRRTPGRSAHTWPSTIMCTRPPLRLPCAPPPAARHPKVLGVGAWHCTSAQQASTLMAPGHHYGLLFIVVLRLRRQRVNRGNHSTCPRRSSQVTTCRMYAGDIKRDHKELGAAHGAVFDQVTLPWQSRLAFRCNGSEPRSIRQRCAAPTN